MSQVSYQVSFVCRQLQAADIFNKINLRPPIDPTSNRKHTYQHKQDLAQFPYIYDSQYHRRYVCNNHLAHVTQTEIYRKLFYHMISRLFSGVMSSYKTCLSARHITLGYWSVVTTPSLTILPIEVNKEHLYVVPPVTNNCSSWISRMERMVTEII